MRNYFVSCSGERGSAAWLIGKSNSFNAVDAEVSQRARWKATALNAKGAKVKGKFRKVGFEIVQLGFADVFPATVWERVSGVAAVTG